MRLNRYASTLIAVPFVHRFDARIMDYDPSLSSPWVRLNGLPPRPSSIDIRQKKRLPITQEKAMLEPILEFVLGGNDAERYRKKLVALSGGLLAAIVLMAFIASSALDPLAAVFGPPVNNWRHYLGTAFALATAVSLSWFAYCSWCWCRYRGA
jgi:hypothetical protein